MKKEKEQIKEKIEIDKAVYEILSRQARAYQLICGINGAQAELTRIERELQQIAGEQK